MAGTFNDVIEELENNLLSYAPLNNFCSGKWSRSLTVQTSYVNRVEIPLNHLPIIVITRPSVEKSFLINTRDGKHIVRLYCGFHQSERDKALQELVGFEENIDDALTKSIFEKVMSLHPQASVNDEGKNHPNYFIVMDLLIQHRRL